jgi:hypothetical protein
MTSHRKITFDELEKAQDILKNGFESGVVTKYEISVLAKYYFSLGMVGNKLKKELIEFCKSHSANFNEVVHRETINYAMSIAEKYNLKVCGDVIITKAEIDIIRSLPYKYAKILFIMTALAKNYKQNKILKKQKNKDNEKYYCNQSLREILRIAKISMPENDIKKMKHYLDAENGYISATEVSSKSWEICIINNFSTPEVIIKDMNKLHDYLPKFCERCKKILIGINKNQKYCEDCKLEVTKESWNKNSRRYYNKKKQLS